MEDSKTLERMEKRISSLSKGDVGHEAEAAAARGLTVVKLHKGFLLCDFIVHDGVSDENGKWHEGAMTTLMDAIASWTAFSFTSQDQVTVHLSVSYYSKPNLKQSKERSRSMEDWKAQERVEKRISSLSKGIVGHEAEAEAAKGVTLVKLRKGFVLCDFVVHDGVSDERGKWHEGAMTTLMDAVGSWAAFSFTSLDQITVYLSVSIYSKPNLQEEVEVEGKAMGKKGRITSVRVEVRTKSDGQMVGFGIMWMAAPSNQINKPPSSSKL